MGLGAKKDFIDLGHKLMDYQFGFTALVQDVFAPNTVGNLPKTDVLLLRLSLPHPCQNQHTPDH